MAKIIVAGVARNCALSINKEISIIENALCDHDIQRFVIVESDSIDNSAILLEQWDSLSEKNFAVSLGHLELQIPKRTQRIAYCRNVYINYFERYDYFGADYLFVTDLDGVNSNLSNASINKTLATLGNLPLSAATANQGYKYYDIWALRHDIWSPNDCWESFHQIKIALGELNAHNICNTSKMVHISADTLPIEVESAFGGGAIYPTSLIRGCRYDGLKSGHEVCEHVKFSDDFRRNGGKVYVFPNFINHDVSPHVTNAENFHTSFASQSMIAY